MTHEQFVVWLHGYLEISGAKTLGEKELTVIKDHLEKFFIKITPKIEDENINHSFDCMCNTCFMKRFELNKPQIVPYKGLDWIYRPEDQPIYNPNQILC